MPNFGSLRRCHSLALPYSAELRLLPAPLREGLTTEDSFDFFRQCFGSFRLREPKKEGGRRRGGSEKGIRKREGVPALGTWLSAWGEWRKRTADLAEGLKRLRETKAASEWSARSRCGGFQRGFVRLRRVEEGGQETAFCACGEVGLRLGFSVLRKGTGFQSSQHACARLPLLPGKVLNSPTVKLGRPLLVAVATE